VVEAYRAGDQLGTTIATGTGHAFYGPDADAGNVAGPIGGGLAAYSAGLPLAPLGAVAGGLSGYSIGGQMGELAGHGIEAAMPRHHKLVAYANSLPRMKAVQFAHAARANGEPEETVNALFDVAKKKLASKEDDDTAQRMLGPSGTGRIAESGHALGRLGGLGLGLATAVGGGALVHGLADLPLQTLDASLQQHHMAHDWIDPLRSVTPVLGAAGGLAILRPRILAPRIESEGFGLLGRGAGSVASSIMPRKNRLVEELYNLKPEEASRYVDMVKAKGTEDPETITALDQALRAKQTVSGKVAAFDPLRQEGTSPDFSRRHGGLGTAVGALAGVGLGAGLSAMDPSWLTHEGQKWDYDPSVGGETWMADSAAHAVAHPVVKALPVAAALGGAGALVGGVAGKTYDMFRSNYGRGVDRIRDSHPAQGEELYRKALLEGLEHPDTIKGMHDALYARRQAGMKISRWRVALPTLAGSIGGALIGGAAGTGLGHVIDTSYMDPPTAWVAPVAGVAGSVIGSNIGSNLARAAVDEEHREQLADPNALPSVLSGIPVAAK
jgi:hypothetical protein